MRVIVAREIRRANVRVRVENRRSSIDLFV
jgi:hypothetical protein